MSNIHDFYNLIVQNSRSDIPNIVFIEGYDKVGKTYLMNELEKLVDKISNDNIRVYHNSWNLSDNSPLSKISKVDYGFMIGLSILDFIRDQRDLFKGKIILIDRSLLSSSAYSILFSRNRDETSKIVDLSYYLDYYKEFMTITHILVVHDDKEVDTKFNMTIDRRELVLQNLDQYKKSYLNHNDIIRSLSSQLGINLIEYINRLD